MKPLVTALGMCAVLACVGATSLTVDTRTWDGSSSSFWNIADNWTAANVPDTCSGPGESAVIASTTNNPVKLNGTGDPFIVNLTMSGATSLNVNGNTLTVTGTFTVDSTNNTTPTPVSITNSSTGGGITASKMVINGGGSGTVFDVSGTTVQTACDVSCPA